MANVPGHVVFNNEIVGYFEYQGSGSVALPPIYAEEGFPTRSGRTAACTCGKPPVPVQLFADYGTGFWWWGEACLTCHAITKNFSDDDSVDGHPLGIETEWMKWCK